MTHFKEVGAALAAHLDEPRNLVGKRAVTFGLLLAGCVAAQRPAHEDRRSPRVNIDLSRVNKGKGRPGMKSTYSGRGVSLEKSQTRRRSSLGSLLRPTLENFASALNRPLKVIGKLGSGLLDPCRPVLPADGEDQALEVSKEQRCIEELLDDLVRNVGEPVVEHMAKMPPEQVLDRGQILGSYGHFGESLVDETGQVGRSIQVFLQVDTRRSPTLPV